MPGDPAPLGVEGEPGGADAHCRTGEVGHRIQGGPARGGAVQERPGEPGEVLDGGTDPAGRRQRLAGPGLPGTAPAAGAGQGVRAQFAGGCRHVERVERQWPAEACRHEVPVAHPRTGRDRVAEEFEPEVGIPRPGLLHPAPQPDSAGLLQQFREALPIRVLAVQEE